MFGNYIKTNTNECFRNHDFLHVSLFFTYEENFSCEKNDLNVSIFNNGNLNFDIPCLVKLNKLSQQTVPFCGPFIGLSPAPALENAGWDVSLRVFFYFISAETVSYLPLLNQYHCNLVKGESSVCKSDIFSFPQREERLQISNLPGLIIASSFNDCVDFDVDIISDFIVRKPIIIFIAENEYVENIIYNFKFDLFRYEKSFFGKSFDDTNFGIINIFNKQKIKEGVKRFWGLEYWKKYLYYFGKRYESNVNDFFAQALFNKPRALFGSKKQFTKFILNYEKFIY